jgi:hypothetical protein
LVARIKLLEEVVEVVVEVVEVVEVVAFLLVGLPSELVLNLS